MSSEARADYYQRKFCYCALTTASYGVTSGAIFYIGVGAAVGAMFLITLVAILCFLRGKKTTANNI